MCLGSLGEAPRAVAHGVMPLALWHVTVCDFVECYGGGVEKANEAESED